MDVTPTSEGIVHIEKDGEDYLGIVTSLKSNSFAVTRLTAQKQSTGYIVRDEEIEPWQATGLTEHGGQVYAFGPYVEGRTLSEVLKYQSDSVLPYLSRLARAMEQLEHHGPPCPIIHTRAIVFLTDGGVLFLPKEVMHTIAAHQNLSDRIEFSDLYNHPDLSEEQNRSFALAVLVYYALTEEFPFVADSDEELRNLMREQVVSKPIYLVPEVRPEISAMLTRILENPRTNAPPLSEWVGHFHEWMKEGTHRDISEEERVDLIAKATTAREHMEKSYRRRQFFRRNWKRMAIIGVIAVIVGSIPATILRNALEPRAIAGLPPEEVVREFYTSINDFDHATMEDAVVDGAGSDLVNEVTNLFVMSRMRMSVELSSGFIDAQVWVDEGRPDVEASRTVYGVANLQITPLGSGSAAERVFRAEYEKWQPRVDRSASEPEPQTGPDAIQGYATVDRVHLRQEGDSWVIFRIERLEHTPIGDSSQSD